LISAEPVAEVGEGKFEGAIAVCLVEMVHLIQPQRNQTDLMNQINISL
jgi:hypothetical protein